MGWVPSWVTNSRASLYLSILKDKPFRLLKGLVLNQYTRGLCKAGVWFSVYYTITTSVGDVYYLSEQSMEPSLSGGQVVFCQATTTAKEFSLFDLSSYCGVNYNKIKVGDIIITKNPTDPNQNVCKRVVGLEGDRIPLQYRDSHRFVPAGRLWVEGDNFTESRDSRNYGPVPLGLVRGRVVARLYPLEKCGLIE